MDIKSFFSNKEAREEFGSKFIKLSRKSVKKIEKQIRKIELEDKSEEIVTERVTMREFERELSRLNFQGRSINKATLEGIDIEKLNYWGVIRFIYEFIGDYNEIKKNCTINTKEGKHNTKGYVYIPSLDISVQGVTSERSMKEIFSQVLGNNFTFSMEILGYPERIIFYNL